MSQPDDRVPLESSAEFGGTSVMLGTKEPVEAILRVLAFAGRKVGAIDGLPGDVENLSQELAAFPRSELIRLIGIICIRSEQVDLAVREQVELFAITDLGMHPHTVEKLNLPTLRGSLAGLLLPPVDEAKTCATCAFRQGTPANQSEPTVADITELLAEDNWRFYCHEGVQEDAPLVQGDGARPVCRGFAQATKGRS